MTTNELKSERVEWYMGLMQHRLYTRVARRCKFKDCTEIVRQKEATALPTDDPGVETWYVKYCDGGHIQSYDMIESNR